MKRVAATALLTFIICWTILLTQYAPTKLVHALGAEQSLLALFLIGAFGGLSLLTSAGYYTTLTTMSLGGVNPLLLGLAGGLGISIGDSIYFATGRESHALLTGRFQRWSHTASEWIAGQHPSIIPAGVFIYAAFTPLPNDVLMVTLALTETDYRNILIPVVLGNIVLTSLIGYGITEFI